MKVIVHVEGGGTRRESRARCREGFSEFFRDAGLDRRDLRVIPGGARAEAYKNFRHEVDRGKSADFVVLLVDSEAPMQSAGAWDHLRAKDGWRRPDHSSDDNVHLMVQCMEAWLVADRETLASYFGQGSISARSRNARTLKASPLSGCSTTSNAQPARATRDRTARVNIPSQSSPSWTLGRSWRRRCTPGVWSRRCGDTSERERLSNRTPSRPRAA